MILRPPRRRSGRLVAGCALSVVLLASWTGPAPARADQLTSVIVTLNEQARVGSFRGAPPRRRHELVVERLQDHARSTQQPVLTRLRVLQLQGEVESIAPLWITNAIAVRATPAAVQSLTRMPAVASVEPEAQFIAPALASSTPGPTPNVEAIGAPTVWADGVTGEDARIAVLDSGVDLSHPDIAQRWVGGSSGWFDPYGQHPSTPFDGTGHGTWVTGVLVGHAASKAKVGVAPGAQWLAARVFNDAGSGTTSGIHQALQWAADPDGNPATNDAPDVINNSWDFATPGCDTEFQPDFQALATLGVVSVFAAGNGGPGTGTSYSPANYPEVISVGAVDGGNGIWSKSSRGPSSCGGRSRVFPDVVAPGSNIKTTDLFGMMTTESGTSVAAPHVSGAVALLRSGRPCVTTSSLADGLLEDAVDLGAAGPDTTFGRGVVDVAAAWTRLQNQGTRPTLTGVAAGAESPASTVTVAATAESPSGIWSAKVTERGKRSSLPATSLSPVSGSFGDCHLDLTKTLDSAGWSVGQHRLSISAKSQDGSSRRSPTGPVVTGPSDLVFADSFETANVNQWSGSRNASDLLVTKGAAMIGAHGLRVTVHRGSRTYLTDEAPTGLAKYQARFWFKPDLARTQRKGHRILVGNRGDGSMLFAIRYRHLTNDTDWLRLGASTAAGTTWTSWRSIAAGAHRLELSWQNGTNGQATLFVDGVQRARLVQPSVGSSTLEQVQLGSVTPPKGAASGAELFDGFASTVSTAIGN